MDVILYSKIKKIVCHVVYVVLLLLLCGCVLLKIYSVISCNTPKEFREMNTVIFAYKFSQGINLYADSVVDSTIPVATSMYGFLVPLLMSPFIRIFSFTPLNALQICEMVTLFVEIVGVLLFYRVAYDRTANHLLCIFGSILFYGCFWRYTANGGAFPDQWGMLLALLLMRVVLKDEKEEKFRPLLYAIIVVLEFYIKQYFVFCAFGLAVFCFIHAKKGIVKLGLCGILTGGVSVLLVHGLFPLYFIETFPMAQGQTSTGDLMYSLNQIVSISGHYYPLISVAAVVGIGINVFVAYKRRSVKGLFSYEFCQMLFTLPFLIYIAQNRGTYYTYYVQLWYPYVIMAGIVSANFMMDEVKSKGKLVVNVLSGILMILLIMFSVYQERGLIRSAVISESQQMAWESAYNLLDEYAGEILVPAHLSIYCVENDIETSEYGQAEFNHNGNLQNYHNSKIWPVLFRDGGVLLQKNIDYNQEIRENIRNHVYSCVAITNMGSYGLSGAELKDAGYTFLTSESLVTGTQVWETEFYVLE